MMSDLGEAQRADTCRNSFCRTCGAYGILVIFAGPRPHGRGYYLLTLRALE